MGTLFKKAISPAERHHVRSENLELQVLRQWKTDHPEDWRRNQARARTEDERLGSEPAGRPEPSQGSVDLRQMAKDYCND